MLIYTERRNDRDFNQRYRNYQHKWYSKFSEDLDESHGALHESEDKTYILSYDKNILWSTIVINRREFLQLLLPLRELPVNQVVLHEGVNTDPEVIPHMYFQRDIWERYKKEPTVSLYSICEEFDSDNKFQINCVQLTSEFAIFVFRETVGDYSSVRFEKVNFTEQYSGYSTRIRYDFYQHLFGVIEKQVYTDFTYAAKLFRREITLDEFAGLISIANFTSEPIINIVAKHLATRELGETFSKDMSIDALMQYLFVSAGGLNDNI